MKLWKTLSVLAILAIGLSLTHCDLGTPPVASGGGGTEVEGIIVDQRGQPAAGVWVHVYPDTSTVLAKSAQSALDAQAAATFLAIRDSAKTNANGAFVLSNLPNGTYNLVVSFRRNDTTLALFRKSIVVTGNLNLGTDTLRVAGSLQIKVAVQGSNIAGAQCYLPGSSYTTVSDSSGLCTLTGLPPGTYQVSVVASGLPAGLSGSIAVVALQITAAGTVNLTWVGPTPPSPICPATGVPPVLRSPDNGATNIPLSTKVIWDSLCGALAYRVQVATDSAFATLVVNDSSSANIGPSRNVTLAASTAYFWRVAGKTSSGWTVFSGARRFTTKSSADTGSAPAAPRLVSPANGGSLQAPVTLSWNAASGATSYRVQISADSTFATLVRNDTTSDTSSQTGTSNAGFTANGSYYWRVVSVNASGTATSSVRKFTITPFNDVVSPAAPTLIAPTDSAANVALSPTFSWNSATGATSYQIQISPNNSFVGTLRGDSLLTATTKSGITLSGSTHYYWRVRGWSANTVSSAGAWSAVRQFTTEAGTTVVTAPSAPTLVTKNDTTFATRTPVLRWNLVVGATYRIQVATDSTFGTMIVNDTLVTSSSSPSKTLDSLTDGMRYFWRVAAYNSAGSSFSAFRRFLISTASSLPTPTLTSPSAGAANVSVNPTFTWSTVTGATSYSLQVSTTTSFAILAKNLDTVNGTSVSTTGLAGGTQYYWRVKARSGSASSSYSATGSFSTEVPAGSVPGPIALAGPTNDTTNVSTTPTLFWKTASGAMSYMVRVATDSTMQTLVVRDSIADPGLTSRTVGPFSNNTTYYWQVSAFNANGGVISERRRFKTRP